MISRSPAKNRKFESNCRTKGLQLCFRYSAGEKVVVLESEWPLLLQGTRVWTLSLHLHMAQDFTSSIYLPRTEKFKVPTPMSQDPLLGRGVYFSSAPHHYYSCQTFECKIWSSSRGDSRMPGVADQALFILWRNREPARA